jgi:ABC-2 type transport system permease protein
MLAGLLTFVVLLLWFVLRALGQGLEEPLRSVVTNISVDQQLQGMLKGVLEVKALVFFVSAIVFWLFLTHRAVEAHRWS